MMKPAVGTEVVVVPLQKKGRVVEVDVGGRYRVMVGAMSMWCREEQLTTVSQGKKHAKRSRVASQAAPPAAHPVFPAEGRAEARALATLDLHGLTVAEALQAVSERLDAALRAGLDRVEIIHGISGGRLRAAVHGYLAGIPVVARFETDARNPGATWVYFG